MLSMVLVGTPALATGTTSGTQTVDTSLTREVTIGNGPVVKAKWEMKVQTNGADDSTTAGAQFLPSGKFDTDTTITVCAVVTDADGVADIDTVYADIFYPTSIYLGANHETNRQGCGQQHGNEFTLKPLSKQAGIDLFCNGVRVNNYNLPVFGTGYNYDEICAETGELWKDTALVYCGNHTLSYEDPSGDYKVLVLGQDKWGLDGTLTNSFRYLPVTAFEADFAAVSYGNVKLNTHKIIPGDLNFYMGDGKPTVRNVGNTRLNMRVMQDDMGLGMTDTSYNVKWDARVGSDASYAVYNPYQTVTLNNPLDLSETDEMDFSIDISKFPPTHDGNVYKGQITLSAVSANHLPCNF